MAYTRIHPIKATIGKSIKYICNPEKTDDYRLVTTHSCSRTSAEYLGKNKNEIVLSSDKDHSRKNPIR